jgi:hypothetical protein
LNFLFAEWLTMFQPFRLGWKKTIVFITQNGVVLINISLFKEKNPLSIRVGAKTDYKENISPTDQTDVGRQNLCRLPATRCRWRLGVDTVTADLHSPTCNENTKKVLIAASFIHLKHKEHAKYTLELTTVNPRIFLSSPAGHIPKN